MPKDCGSCRNHGRRECFGHGAHFDDTAAPVYPLGGRVTSKDRASANLFDSTDFLRAYLSFGSHIHWLDTTLCLLDSDVAVVRDNRHKATPFQVYLLPVVLAGRVGAGKKLRNLPI